MSAIVYEWQRALGIFVLLRDLTAFLGFDEEGDEDEQDQD